MYHGFYCESPPTISPSRQVSLPFPVEYFNAVHYICNLSFLLSTPFSCAVLQDYLTTMLSVLVDSGILHLFCRALLFQSSLGIVSSHVNVKDLGDIALHCRTVVCVLKDGESVCNLTAAVASLISFLEFLCMVNRHYDS